MNDEDEPALDLSPREAVCPACTLIHLRSAGLAACDMPEGLLAA